MEIQGDRHATHLLHAHLVFVTKYHYKVLAKKHLEYLENIFKETMKERGGQLIEFDGESDHVHLLIQYPPKHSVSKIVNNLKGRSSRLLRRDMPDVKQKYWAKPDFGAEAIFSKRVASPQGRKRWRRSS